MIKNCPDCGQPLFHVPGQLRLYFCPTTRLYYVSNRGKLGYPLQKPPQEMTGAPPPQETPSPKPESTPISMTKDEMLNHPRFVEFATRQYGELPLQEALFQIKGADPTTKRIIRQDFFNWLQTN